MPRLPGEIPRRTLQSYLDLVRLSLKTELVSVRPRYTPHFAALRQCQWRDAGVWSERRRGGFAVPIVCIRCFLCEGAVSDAIGLGERDPHLPIALP